MTQTLITVTDLCCERSGRELFSDLNFTVCSGSISQICGANGAGKTTLLRILAGLSADFEGLVDYSFATDKHPGEELLYIGHMSGMKSELSALENLDWILSFNNAENTDRDSILSGLKSVGLGSRGSVPLMQLSEGQKRRVALTRIWLEKKALWILDEPYTALDAEGIKLLEAAFVKHLANGGAIILATHQALGAALTPTLIELGGVNE